MKLIKRTNLFLIMVMVLSLILQPIHPVLAAYGDSGENLINQVINEE